jgi:SSS family solute:Na+ symporter
MWGALTASVWVAAAGSVIIGGLYWSRGTTAGAWWAMGVGISVSAWGILVKDHFWAFEMLEGTAFAAIPGWFRPVHENAWISGQVLAFSAMAVSIVTYIGVSLVTGGGRRFNLDRMLFRGPYRELLPPSERDFREDAAAEARGQPPAWMRKLGFTREFDRTDTWITWITVAWPLAWTIVLVAGTAWAATRGVSERSWLAFWEFWTWLIFATGCVIVAWFTWGGLRDLLRMKGHLERYRADARDDGTVRETPR